MATIRELLLKIPKYGELAVQEHIRQKDEDLEDSSILDLDTECHSSVRKVLYNDTFYWNKSIEGYSFWKEVYDKLNE